MRRHACTAPTRLGTIKTCLLGLEGVTLVTPIVDNGEVPHTLASNSTNPLDRAVYTSGFSDADPLYV